MNFIARKQHLSGKNSRKVPEDKKNRNVKTSDTRTGSLSDSFLPFSLSGDVNFSLSRGNRGGGLIRCQIMSVCVCVRVSEGFITKATPSHTGEELYAFPREREHILIAAVLKGRKTSHSWPNSEFRMKNSTREEGQEKFWILVCAHNAYHRPLCSREQQYIHSWHFLPLWLFSFVARWRNLRLPFPFTPLRMR